MTPGASLISIDAARERVLAAVQPLDAEEVPLTRALGRVLAETVVSGLSVPPFRSSAMDGYAVAAGPEAELEVIGESRAGQPAAMTVGPGTAVRVSTGAVVPEGADAVVPVENAGVAAPNGRVRVPAVVRGRERAPSGRGRVRRQASCSRRAARSVPRSWAWPPRWGDRPFAAAFARGWRCW